MDLACDALAISRAPCRQLEQHDEQQKHDHAHLCPRFEPHPFGRGMWVRLTQHPVREDELENGAEVGVGCFPVLDTRSRHGLSVPRLRDEGVRDTVLLTVKEPSSSPRYPLMFSDAKLSRRGIGGSSTWPNPAGAFAEWLYSWGPRQPSRKPRTPQNQN